MSSSIAWKKKFDELKINKHNFKKTKEKEPRILCKQDSREDRPAIFKENNLFILPVKNGHYAIIKGEGYEGKNKIVLVEAKNSNTSNIIIRQLYYPFRQWKISAEKNVELIFFEKKQLIYNLWRFEFTDEKNYNSISLIDSIKYKIKP